tara:strand:+ start:49 stop:312 length:264 start_codon:yes stop_codon:yes gene_type:complete
MKQLVKEGFLKKDNKAFKPDPETGEWRGRETKNGNFSTIKPGWSGEFDVNGKKHKLELWGFNTRWGSQSMYFKLYKVKNEERLEDQM